ncbi:MAG: hypothetical protein ACI306_08745 [Muribaculaceae bacterium]
MKVVILAIIILAIAVGLMLLRGTIMQRLERRTSSPYRHHHH